MILHFMTKFTLFKSDNYYDHVKALNLKKSMYNKKVKIKVTVEIRIRKREQ